MRGYIAVRDGLGGILECSILCPFNCSEEISFPNSLSPRHHHAQIRIEGVWSHINQPVGNLSMRQSLWARAAKQGL